MTSYPATDYPTQADLEQLQRLFPHDEGIQNITLPALIAEIQTLDMDTLPPVAHYRVPRAVLTPCELAIASLVVECIFTVFDVGLVGQTGVDNAVSDNVLNAIGPRLGDKLNLLGRLAHVVSGDPDATKLAKAVAVVRIVFLVEALGLIATILEEVIKGFSLLTGAFFALKVLAKMMLALATDGASLILGSIALLLTDTSNIIVKATAVSTQCGPNAAPIAAPLTGLGVPVSPQSPPALYAVAMNSHGTLYVPDCANARIQTWAPNATAGVTIIQGNAGPGAPNPADPARASALAVAADGTVYTINSYPSKLPGSVYKRRIPQSLHLRHQQPPGAEMGVRGDDRTDGRGGQRPGLRCEPAEPAGRHRAGPGGRHLRQRHRELPGTDLGAERGRRGARGRRPGSGLRSRPAELAAGDSAARQNPVRRRHRQRADHGLGSGLNPAS